MAATEPLVVIVGQTASGKSALAMQLAQKFNGEIICADSRTIYRGMDIGTAKPSKEDQAKIRHHLLDVVEPGERFTVADFKAKASAAIKEIASRGKLPIMVGGTGLYVDSVVYDYQFSDSNAPKDPINPRHLATNLNEDQSTNSGRQVRLNTLIIGLEVDKETLRIRVEQRVEVMLKEGLIDEVKVLLEKYGLAVEQLSATSYGPFIEHLNGTLSLEEAKAQFIKNDMNLAKRQRTWFKRNKSIQWVQEQGQAVELVTTFLYKS